MSRSAALRVVALCALAFLLMASYAIARPATESLFLAEHGTASLPRAWVFVAALTVLVVARYNRWSAGQPLTRVFALTSLGSAGLLAALLALRAVHPSAYLLYAFKELYIVVLVEIFWSYANSVYPVRSARWTYGIFCAAGAAGGFVANMSVGDLARRIGTESAIGLVVPILAVVGLAALAFAKKVEGEAPAPPHAGFALLARSRYVRLLVILIAVTQLVITLIDYAYSGMLEAAYPEIDARTKIIGQVYAAIDVGSFTLQMATGLILRAIGVRGALLAIPTLLALSLGAYLVAPGFLAMAVAKVASKAMDYSLFRAAKEILYIPLAPEEKTQGKAIADMLAYRVAKGAASFMLMGMAALALGAWVLAPAFALLAVWGGLSWALTKRAPEG